MSKQLYTYTCPRCKKVFRTDNPEQKICSDCSKHGQPFHKARKKKPKKHVLTFAEISHIVKVYDKIHHKFLHYGDVVSLVDRNAERCVCCGATIPEGRQICPQCEIKAGE